MLHVDKTNLHVCLARPVIESGKRHVGHAIELSDNLKRLKTIECHHVGRFGDLIGFVIFSHCAPQHGAIGETFHGAEPLKADRTIATLIGH